ncbi:O-antigen polymerase [Marinobacter sp. DS40M6]|uniref:O-antigen polymerase n=1 Tax=Marinobacter sp. DS40M6 TaxID=1597776 RepID=UPI002359A738|nr:O-antigen polymerase [Marinobacter sp. DS40M6]MDC8456138.1 oligosaccharide repeat unit polymerase [Marinobacter sp. DS40M6]
MGFNLVAAFIFLFFSFAALKRSPVSAYISALIAFTYISGILVGNFPTDVGFSLVINFIFIALILLAFCCTFRGKKIFWIKEDYSIVTQKWFLFSLSLMLTIVTATNILIVYSSISYVLGGNIDITAFKNQGGAAEMIRVWADPRLVFLSYGFSPLAYFSLALHFYFIFRGRVFLSLVFFIFSLNIPLVGLHSLSRSSIVHYFLLYFLIYCACYGGIPDKVKRKVNLIAGLFFTGIVAIFALITTSRFSGSSFSTIPGNSFVSSPILYSILNYASQWIVNSIGALEDFSLNHIWFGKSTFTVFDIVTGMIGFDTVDYGDLRQETLGQYSTKFIGLVATLVYEFSYIGAIYYVCLFYLFFRFLAPGRFEMRVSGILILIVFSSQPLMFFTNNYLGNTMYAIGAFYAIMIYILSNFFVKLNVPKY